MPSTTCTPNFARFDPLGLFEGAVEVYRREGLGWTEGPVWYNETFYFSDTMRDVIGMGVDGIAATGSGGGASFSGQLEPGSNGLFISGDDLLVCQHGARRVVSTPLASLSGGTFEHASVVSSSAVSLNSPNDVIVRDNVVYFTDPIYGFLSEELPFDRPELDETCPVKGVYRVERPGKAELIATAQRPNGLAFDPEGTLWIANSEIGNMSVFSMDGRLLRIDECYGEGAVDGIKIDERGWLWTTVPGGIAVIDLESEKILARLKVGRTSNLNFGGGYLWITGLGHVWRIRLRERQFATAFFINTDSRSDKTSSISRLVAKTAVLLATLAALDRLWDRARRRPRLCFLMSTVFVGRVLLQMFWFWDRAISLVEIFAEAGFIIPLSLFSLAFAARSKRFLTTKNFDYLGLCLFFLGTALNVGSELDRHVRRSPGHLYTQGPFAIVRHPNYTGEILSFVGFALSSGNLLNLWIPLLMAVGMVLFSAPELDLYLANKYPLDWVDYAPSVPDSFLPLSSSPLFEPFLFLRSHS